MRSLHRFKKKPLKDKEKREEGNKQCNTENVLKRGIIPSHKNEIGYAQPHTTPHTNFPIKIHACKNPYICTLCGNGSISNTNIKSHINSHDDKNMNHCALFGRTFKSRNHLNIHFKRSTENDLCNCAMCQRDYLQEPYTKTHEKSCLRELISVCSPWQ